MSEIPHRFEHIRRSMQLARLLAVIGVGLVVVIAGYSIGGEYAPWGWFREHLLSFGLIAAACLLIATFVFLWIAVNLLLKLEGNSFRSYGVLRDVHARLDTQGHDLKIISENVQVSDIVLSITHRGRERNAIRLAFNEEIIRGDFEAANALVELLESRHGYRNEAARLREEVDLARGREKREKLHDSVIRLQGHMDAHDWDRARREMDRLVAEHPDHDQVRALPDRFARLQSEHKRRLLKEWDQTVHRNDVDRSIAILKELDQFLTRNEAAALEESARGVFRAKLRNLAVQFSLAVSGQEWRDAYEAGQEIIREFPNSRMAEEVKGRIHVLAKRAAEPIPLAAESQPDS